MQAIQTLPAALAAARPWFETRARAFRARLAAARRRRLEAATRLALEALDDVTLRDIGLTRPEISSVAAELHGGCVATRLARAPHLSA
jgi:uncharacterized protein YjiS (DUF1127 family)